MKSLRYVAALLILPCWTGCGRTPTQTVVSPVDRAIAEPGPLRILVLEDPPLASAIELEWRARSEGAVQVTQGATAELCEQLDKGLTKLDVDVVIFPSAMLGELCERRLIRPLPNQLTNESSYQPLDIFDLVRREEMLWDQRAFAVPLGSPPLVLLARTDLVSQVPSTWVQLHSEVERLRQSLPADVTPLAQPLAAGWPGRLLLSRAAAYLHDPSRVSTVFDYRTLEPRINSPALVRGLQELADDDVENPVARTPAEVLQEFLAGKAAMAITWPSATNTVGEMETVPFPVTISELPGSNQRYDVGEQTWLDTRERGVRRVTVAGVSGRLGAISRAAKNVALATTFLGWATGPAQGNQISPRSTATCPFRESQLSHVQLWVNPQLSADVALAYGQVLTSAFRQPASLPWLRIPQEYRYADLLDQAVWAVLHQQADPATALRQAADGWRTLNQQLGLDEQGHAYRRSLGVEMPQ